METTPNNPDALPRLDALIADLAAAGRQLTEMDAAEGSAGNLSIFVRDLPALPGSFSHQGEISLPVAALALNGGWLVVTAGGRRLRDIGDDPAANLCLLHVQAGGARAELYAAHGIKPTSELNSHLAIHDDKVGRSGLSFQAIVHAQPRNLTYLSHLPAYGDSQRLSRRLVRWQPETILTFPDGIGLAPFQPPGSLEQMATTLGAIQQHRLVVWQRHGVIARSERSAVQAANLVEYAETAAFYETLNLLNPRPVEGLSDEELGWICAQNGIRLPAFL